MHEHTTKLVRVSENNWQLFKMLKKFQKMSADDVIDELVEFYLRCHEP